MPSPNSASNSCSELRWRLAKSVHLLLAEGEIVLEHRAHRARALRRSRHPAPGSAAAPSRRAAGVAPHGLIAVLFDIREHVAHAIRKPPIGLARGGFSLLEEFHHVPILSDSFANSYATGYILIF